MKCSACLIIDKRLIPQQAFKSSGINNNQGH